MLREQGYMTFSKDQNSGGVICNFGNGSKIFACALGEQTRGHRSQCVICDECALCSKTLYQSVAEPTLAQRQFAGRPHDYEESVKQIFLSSARAKTNWLWRFLVQCVNGHYKQGRVKYGFMCVDALSGVASGIQSPTQYLSRKASTDDMTFEQEYLNVFLSNGENSIFKLEDFEQNRVLKQAFYPRDAYEYLEHKPNPYNYLDNEIRFISCDIALATGNENDNSVYTFMAVDKDTGRRKIENIICLNGLNTVRQVELIKRIFYEYKATYLLLDTRGVGGGLYDLLTVPTEDTEYGITYPAWTVVQDFELQITSNTVMNDKIQRTLSSETEEVIIPFVATPEINHEMHLSFRKALKDQNIDLLVDDMERKVELEDNDKTFAMLSPETKATLMLPYMQTRIMMNEAIALEVKNLDGGKIKLVEGRSAVKDRYISSAMGNLLADKIYTKSNKEVQQVDDLSQWSFLSGNFSNYFHE